MTTTMNPEKWMNRTVWVTALATALVCSAAADLAEAQAARRHVLPEARGYFTIGGVDLDLAALNESLARRYFEELDGTMLSLGGGGHVFLGHWLLGFEGFGLVPRAADTAARDWRARLTGGAALLNVGYAVARTGGTSVYPMVGLGGGGWMLELTQRAAPTFDDIIANPARGSSLTQMAMLVQPALGVDHFVAVGAPGLRGGLILGLRAGYTFSPFTSDWFLDTIPLPGGPGQGMEGPFVRFVIGGGTRSVGRGGAR
jgi:hypothetical protein